MTSVKKMRYQILPLSYIVIIEMVFARLPFFLRKFSITHYIWSASKPVIARYHDNPSFLIYPGTMTDLTESNPGWSLVFIMALVLIMSAISALSMSMRDTN